MSSADPFSSRFEVFGREPKHLVGKINQQPFEKLKRLLDVKEGGDGRVILLRAPRAGFGKTYLLQRLASEFAETHHFVRVNLISGRTTDAAHVLEYVLQALCQVLPESSTLTKLDYLARKVLALGLEPLVASGEVPCQDRDGALQALREQPTETFDFHHDRAVTAHWTKSNFEILGPRLAAELGRMSGASLREASYWVELLFRFATTAPDNVERARLLFETVFRGDLNNQSESAAEERLHGLLALMGSVTSLVLIIDDTEGLSTHPPDALALSSFLSNLSQCCPGTLVLLSVNEDIWESAFLPLLPGGLADRLTEYDVALQPLTTEQAHDLIRSRAGDRAGEVLARIDLDEENLYARHVLKAASDAWDTLEQVPSLAVVEEAVAAKDRDEVFQNDDFTDELDELDDLDDDFVDDLAEPAAEPDGKSGLVTGALAGAALVGAGAAFKSSSGLAEEGSEEDESVARQTDSAEAVQEPASVADERVPDQPMASPFAKLEKPAAPGPVEEAIEAEADEQAQAEAKVEPETGSSFPPTHEESAVEREPEIVLEEESESESDESEEEAIADPANEEFANPFAPKLGQSADPPMAFSAPVEDAPAEEEKKEELAEEPVGAKTEESRPFTSAAPAQKDSFTAFADDEAEVEKEPAAAAVEETLFTAKTEAEPASFVAEESVDPDASSASESHFAKANDPPAESPSNPFMAKSESPAAAPAEGSVSNPFFAKIEEPKLDAESEKTEAPPLESPVIEQEESRPFAAEPPSEPATANAEPAAENPFAPKFGQPFAPPADQRIESDLAPSDFSAPVDPGESAELKGEASTSFAGAAPETDRDRDQDQDTPADPATDGDMVGESASPPAGPPPLYPQAQPEVSAFSPPPSVTSPSLNPFGAGSSPVEPEGFGPPPVPTTESETPAPPHQPATSPVNLSSAFQPNEEPPPPLSPGSTASPTSTESPDAGSAPPSSPFAAVGRGASEKNLGEVSSIFAPIRPEEGVTLDPEKLTPLLDEADQVASDPDSSAAPATTSDAAQAASNPFAAGAPPESTPESANPFAAKAAPTGDSPFAAPSSASSVQNTGPSFSTPPESLPESPSTSAPHAPESSSAFTPRPGIDSSSGFGAAAVGPFGNRESSEGSNPEEFAAPPAPTPPSDESLEPGGDEVGELEAGERELEKDAAWNIEPVSPFAKVTPPFAESAPPAKGDFGSRDEAESTPKPSPAFPGADKPVKIAFSPSGDSASLDAPFRPLGTPAPQPVSDSPFAKVEPGGTTPFAPRTELPPRKSEVKPPPPAGGHPSPFEPGLPPSFETPPPPPITLPPSPSPGPGPGPLTESGFASAGNSDSDSASGPRFEAPAELSTPFAVIGKSSQERPPFSDPEPAAFPAYGDSDDQDKVDELLRQFKERYGRK